jgi:hypothetical protein
MSNLAGALQRLSRGPEAEALYRGALQIDPAHGPALRNFAVLSRDSSDWRQARALYARAAELGGGLELTLQAHLALAPIAASATEIPAQRAAYKQGLDALGDAPQAFAYSGEPLNLQWFNLAYHGQDDRGLLECTAEVLMAKVSGLAYRSPALEAWRAPLCGDRRIRVAFCSELLHEHTVGRLYAGFIEHLDRQRFEVIIVHGPRARTDAFRAALDAMADQAVDLVADLREQRTQVEALGLDVLLFPDIGMSSATYFLAASRLAPVQAVSWGHPNTTGLPTLDYFISGDSVEAAGAEAHYGERLVRMRRLPCFYEPPQLPAPTTREALGLPECGALRMSADPVQVSSRLRRRPRRDRRRRPQRAHRPGGIAQRRLDGRAAPALGCRSADPAGTDMLPAADEPGRFSCASGPYRRAAGSLAFRQRQHAL